MNQNWEGVAGEPGRADYTDRLRVPGGWLYRTRAGGTVALAFVPKASESAAGPPRSPAPRPRTPRT